MAAGSKSAPRVVARGLHLALRYGPPLVISAVMLCAVFLRLTVRDQAPPLFAYWFYATPPPVLAVLAALIAAWLFLVRARRWAGVASAGVLAFAGWTYGTCWVRASSAAPAANAAPPCRAMFWNVYWGQYGWDEIVNEIRRREPDVVGLVESTDPLKVGDLDWREMLARRNAELERMQAFWEERLPGYRAFVDPTGITLLARVPVLAEVRRGALQTRRYTALGRYVHGTVQFGDKAVHVFVVDISNELGTPRGETLDDLCDAVEAVGGEPTLILGDFNTPPDSVHFGRLRRSFRQAFETAGRGWGPTWPLPAPVLWLDHIWVSARLEVVRCAAGWSGASDHRPLVVEFRP